jgi:hypothetical protein
MSAKRFNSRGVIILLLAMGLVGGGCASLKPPILAPNQTVEEEGGGIQLPATAPPHDEETPNPSHKAWEITRTALDLLISLGPIVRLLN